MEAGLTFYLEEFIILWANAEIIYFQNVKFAKITYHHTFKGAKGVWDFQISDLVKTLIELIFNPCGEFW